ncbi:MAG TPA: response regulator [Hyphomicrobiaceae bacterium]|nr:response regulator [Hyphomicrobiaceae bacterium]
MDRSLAGHTILIVEDEPLVALDVSRNLEDAGALVLMARTLDEALSKAEEPNLSAAVLDHGLSEGDTSAVCEILKRRRIPFVLYSGYSEISGACSKGVLVQKPTSPAVLVMTLAGLLPGRPTAH